ncbi:Methyltransferase domain protein [Gemmata obscuriglobus]|uniref:SAM-dependent methyltransferase n=1 Tax=Gemmata obscuriglobus TaxID=114 RepID=A0A2Z3GZ26_9BACT|nr:class I SAM-dependent methyltransferase [Gemmata obscuriglobus]AWM36105.1 SAM-dependent methyltransferase [Gemmata obscuriglobus]QEG31308.1 Methyltransferase domain protein [Gemmata obscuriglobus]VTS10647.1 Methyltransferase OS=Streptomyces rapamycinicus NRRL 5491 GN=M271_21080 PE=4 SV=1: Methyltransf_18 [Gemmata obscuriglobus UQM 2246]
MDLETFRELLSPTGQRLLRQAVSLQPTETTFLTCAATLRKHHAPALAQAALETALLRTKAREKFADAALMYFTREALEQSTSEIVGRHRARRFAEFGNVADLCCGIGADAIALARAGLTVAAVDLDPLRVAMCGANAAALGVTDRVRGIAGDALAAPLPDARAAFADPDRRANGRRFLDPEDYSPSLGALRGRFGADFPLGVKIAPGVAKSDIPSAAEAEFVSLRGELKECILWFGPLRQAVRRATVLPSGETLTGEGEASPPPPLAERVGEVLYDPDPAVTRAGLVPQLAERLSAEATDFEVQLLTGGAHAPTAFATAYRVEHAAPFHPNHLRDYLRERQIGRVTVINRGSPADPAEVVKKLKLKGPGHRGVLLTRVRGAHTAVVCERLG